MLHYTEMSRLVQLPQEIPHPAFRHSTAVQVMVPLAFHFELH